MNYSDHEHIPVIWDSIHALNQYQQTVAMIKTTRMGDLLSIVMVLWLQYYKRFMRYFVPYREAPCVGERMKNELDSPRQYD